MYGFVPGVIPGKYVPVVWNNSAETSQRLRQLKEVVHDGQCLVVPQGGIIFVRVPGFYPSEIKYKPQINSRTVQG